MFPHQQNTVTILQQYAADAVRLYTGLQQLLALIAAYGIMSINDETLTEYFPGITQQTIKDMVQLVNQTLTGARAPIDPTNRPALDGLTVLLLMRGPGK